MAKRYRKPQSAIRCPKPCGKIRFYSEKEAWDTARMRFRELGGEMAKRAYECDLTPGFWHLTRQESWSA